MSVQVLWQWQDAVQKIPDEHKQAFKRLFGNDAFKWMEHVWALQCSAETLAEASYLAKSPDRATLCLQSLVILLQGGSVIQEARGILSSLQEAVPKPLQLQGGALSKQSVTATLTLIAFLFVIWFSEFRVRDQEHQKFIVSAQVATGLNQASCIIAQATSCTYENNVLTKEQIQSVYDWLNSESKQQNLTLALKEDEALADFSQSHLEEYILTMMRVFDYKGDTVQVGKGRFFAPKPEWLAQTLQDEFDAYRKQCTIGGSVPFKSRSYLTSILSPFKSTDALPYDISSCPLPPMFLTNAQLTMAADDAMLNSFTFLVANFVTTTSLYMLPLYAKENPVARVWYALLPIALFRPMRSRIGTISSAIMNINRLLSWSLPLVQETPSFEYWMFALIFSLCGSTLYLMNVGIFTSYRKQVYKTDVERALEDRIAKLERLALLQERQPMFQLLEGMQQDIPLLQPNAMQAAPFMILEGPADAPIPPVEAASAQDRVTRAVRGARRGRAGSRSRSARR